MATPDTEGARMKVCQKAVLAGRLDDIVTEDKDEMLKTLWTWENSSSNVGTFGGPFHLHISDHHHIKPEDYDGT